MDIELVEAIAILVKSYYATKLRQAGEVAVEEYKKKIGSYQHGFIRDDGTGEPERAPEWQVIEDLLTYLKDNEEVINDGRNIY